MHSCAFLSAQNPRCNAFAGMYLLFPPRAWTSFYPETSTLQYISLPIFIEKVQLSALQEKLGKAPGPLSCRSIFNRIFEGLSSAKGPSLPKKLPSAYSLGDWVLVLSLFCIILRYRQQFNIVPQCLL